MTPSEQLVFDLCKRSALSLWNYANPRRPDGRELCDILVAFGKHIVVFSVKEIALKESKDPSVAAKRWTRKAIDESIGQLMGAKRELKTMAKVVRQDGSEGIQLPTVDARELHLVAIAAGSKRQIPYSSGVIDSEYVHVFDELALQAILSELDAISDFVNYLDATESLRGTVVCSGGEEDLLALYIQNGRQFPKGPHLIITEEGAWAQLSNKPECIARKKEDHVSYWWDSTIETLIRDCESTPEVGPTLTELETVVRTMAAENRFQRRMLSEAIVNWVHQRQAGARTMVSPSGVAYVFATYSRDFDREARRTSLRWRCFVARSPSVTGCSTVLGIATETYDPSGFSLDAVYLHLPEWTEEDEQKAQEAREKFGFMNAPTVKRASFQEFPSVPPSKMRNKNAAKRERQKGRYRKKRKRRK